MCVYIPREHDGERAGGVKVYVIPREARAAAARAAIAEREAAALAEKRKAGGADE